MCRRDDFVLQSVVRVIGISDLSSLTKSRVFNLNIVIVMIIYIFMTIMIIIPYTPTLLRYLSHLSKKHRNDDVDYNAFI